MNDDLIKRAEHIIAVHKSYISNGAPMRLSFMEEKLAMEIIRELITALKAEPVGDVYELLKHTWYSTCGSVDAREDTDKRLRACAAAIAQLPNLNELVVILEEGAEPEVGDVISRDGHIGYVGKSRDGSGELADFVINNDSCMFPKVSSYLLKHYHKYKIIQRNGKPVVYMPTDTNCPALYKSNGANDTNLQSKLDIATEALEFYAKGENATLLLHAYAGKCEPQYHLKDKGQKAQQALKLINGDICEK